MAIKLLKVKKFNYNGPIFEFQLIQNLVSQFILPLHLFKSKLSNQG